MIVLGADTHKRSHTIAGVGATTGELVGERTVQVGRAGFAALLAWARELDGERVWALEDCRHVSGSFERFLIERGERVLRVPTNLMAEPRKSARQRGKSDGIDAVNVARAALREGLTTFPVAHLDGPELDLRLLVDHRERLVSHRVELNNTLQWHLHDLWPELELPGGALFSKKRSTRIARRLARAEHTMRVLDRARRAAPPARAHRDDQGARPRDHRARRADRAAAARRARLRAAHRGQAHRRDRRCSALRHRRQARPRGRRRADPRQFRQHPAPAPGPRRQPPDQRRAASHHRYPRPLPPANP
jgi:transposase